MPRNVITRHQVLHYVSQIFDPLGLLVLITFWKGVCTEVMGPQSIME